MVASVLQSYPVITPTEHHHGSLAMALLAEVSPLPKMDPARMVSPKERPNGASGRVDILVGETSPMSSRVSLSMVATDITLFNSSKKTVGDAAK